jgi:hypothetical protein
MRGEKIVRILKFMNHRNQKKRSRRRPCPLIISKRGLCMIGLRNFPHPWGANASSLTWIEKMGYGNIETLPDITGYSS